MTDLPSIVAAYGLVLGGIGAYALSVARRTAAARRVAAAIERQRGGRPTPAPTTSTRERPPGPTG